MSHQKKYNITGRRITPIACVFLIFAKEDTIPTGVEIKKITSPNQPVNIMTISVRKIKTAEQSFE